MRLLPQLLSGLLGAGAFPLLAADHVIRYQFEPEDGILSLSLAPNTSSYYTLLVSPDLTLFSPVSMALGAGGAEWEYAVRLDLPLETFQVLARSVFAPGDADGDGIDDLYELQNPDRLNPFNPADATQPSGVGGMTNYQKYLRDLLWAWNMPLQFTGQQVSLFNHGAPTARLEGISFSLSVYNALPGSGPPVSDIDNTVSTEVSLFNLGAASARIEAIGNEATVWNFGSPSARLEAMSSEVTLYNASPGSSAPVSDIGQTVSAEVSVHNFGAPTAPVEAISREVSVLNFEDPS